MFRRCARAAAVTAMIAGIMVVAETAGSESFPGANCQIAFSSKRDGNTSNKIYVMNQDGTGAVPITGTLSGDHHFPAWSPDGTRIAFTNGARLWTMDADGTNRAQLPNSLDERDPGWSPDSSKIVFWSNRDGQREIYRVNANGTSPTRLTNNPAEDAWPSWSPNGTKIAFGSNREGQSEIYVMAANGSNQVRLTDNPAHDNFPSWSPDGTRIAFSSDRDGQSEIYVMDADGTDQIRLTDDPAPDDHPTWSPDGSMILFHTNSGGGDLHAMNSDGSGRTNLTAVGGQDEDASWQAVSGAGPASISGTVTESGTGEPLAAIVVTVRSIDGSVVRKVKSQPDGTWTVGDLDPGSYTAKFRDRDGGQYLEEYHDDAGSLTSSTVLGLCAGEDAAGVDAALTPIASTGSITGTVTAADGPASGEPLGGMTVVLTTASLSKITKVKTAPDGTWTVPNLMPGSYRLKIRDIADVYVEEWWDDTTMGLAAPVTVTAGSATTADASLHHCCA